VTEEHKGKQMIREDRGQVRGDSGIGKPQSENLPEEDVFRGKPNREVDISLRESQWRNTKTGWPAGLTLRRLHRASSKEAPGHGK
jgi:hypothetical protein